MAGHSFLMPKPYVLFATKVVAALLNTVSTPLAKLCIEAIAASPTGTTSRPYSTKSWAFFFPPEAL